MERVCGGRLALNTFKGAIYSLCIAMIFIILLAFIVKWTSLEESVINPLNQIIKIISIFFGVAIALKGCEKWNMVIGLIVGALFSLLAFILFSILNGSFEFSFTVVYDLLFSAVVGLISAIIVKFLKK